MADIKFEIIETGKYLELVDLFTSSGLEVHLDGDAPKDFITCWKAALSETGELAGGVSIERRGGEYVISDIAVREDLRDLDIGTALAKTAMARIMELGAEQIYLVAKAPKFFEKFGFTYLTPEETPDIFSCYSCPSRGKTCNPEFMTWKKEK